MVGEAPEDGCSPREEREEEMKIHKSEYFAAFGFIAALSLGLMLAAWAAACG